MPRRADNLFGGIAAFGTLLAAARRAIRGKRRKPGAAAFMANLETEVLALERGLRDHSYRPGRYVAFEVHEPKKRMVSAAPFRDRVVHHALCAVIGPEPAGSRSRRARQRASREDRADFLVHRGRQ